MSASPIEYHTANQVVPEQVPIDLAPCSKCGSELAIFKVEQVSDRELITHWRCDDCYYPMPTLIRFVFVPVEE